MLLGERSGAARPVLFCLHFLGGSAREWSAVARFLEPDLECIAIDLPGFGDAARQRGYSVAEMTDAVAQTIAAAAPKRWLLAGHSMGAKVAAAVARRAEDGVEGLAGLAGLILLAGSPPAPEPMPDAQRETMRSWFGGDPDSRRSEAAQYVAQNCSRPLDASLSEQTIGDVLRANRAAWLAWLDGGSREDWSDIIGILATPTLLIAGVDDENLGADAQERLTAPHLAHGRLVTIAGAKHLLPLENPTAVAELIADHAQAVERESRRVAAMDDAYRGLIASNRVGSVTRHALLERERPADPNAAPAALTVEGFAVLRAVTARIVPQPPQSPRIDLAARIDAELAAGVGDGWRFAELPPDVAAYHAGLLTLDDAAQAQMGQPFVAVDGRRQDELLAALAAGQSHAPADATAPAGRLTAPQMRAWFEDVRAATVRAYVSHPQTLARMGFSGIANGGDGEPKSGFVQVGIGEREPWEPLALAEEPA